MPACQVCNGRYERVAAFCPNCGAPLTTLAARMREAGARPAVIGAAPGAEAPVDDVIVLPETEERSAAGETRSH
ncbi:MAG: hypothetical protein ACXWXQ_12095 [Actinomycetota bacterium]